MAHSAPKMRPEGAVRTSGRSAVKIASDSAPATTRSEPNPVSRVPADGDDDVGDDHDGRTGAEGRRRGRRRSGEVSSSRAPTTATARTKNRAIADPEPSSGSGTARDRPRGGDRDEEERRDELGVDEDEDVAGTVPGSVRAYSPPTASTSDMSRDQAKDHAAPAGRTSPRHHTHCSAQKPPTTPAARSCRTVTHVGTDASTKGTSSPGRPQDDVASG